MEVRLLGCRGSLQLCVEPGVLQRDRGLISERLRTAYANRKLALEALEKGASGFVKKPMTSETFLDAVRQAILRGQLRRPSTGSG